MHAMAAPDPGRPEPGPDASIDEIQADIEQTRHELGQTVEALSDKLDVKERAREKVAETRDQVVEKADAVKHTATDNPQRTVPIAAAVIGALVVGIVVWRRRR
jgi:hypothetical protein